MRLALTLPDDVSRMADVILTNDGDPRYTRCVVRSDKGTMVVRMWPRPGEGRVGMRKRLDEEARNYARRLAEIIGCSVTVSL